MFAVPYSQYDHRWRDDYMGNTPYTLGRFGCYTTFIASTLAGTFQKKGQDGLPLTPGELCYQLSLAGGYDGDAQVQWGVLTRLYPDTFLYKFVTTTNYPGNAQETSMEKASADIRRALRLGFPVGLTVDNVDNDGWPDHIVTGISATTPNLMDLLITDPDGGSTRHFSEKYGDPMKKIYGYRLLIGPPTQWPLYSTRQDQDAGIAAWKAGEVYRGRNVATYSKEILDTLMSE